MLTAAASARFPRSAWATAAALSLGIDFAIGAVFAVLVFKRESSICVDAIQDGSLVAVDLVAEFVAVRGSAFKASDLRAPQRGAGTANTTRTGLGIDLPFALNHLTVEAAVYIRILH